MRLVPFALLVACGTASGPDATPTPTGEEADVVSLVYQSRVDGEIEPCG